MSQKLENQLNLALDTPEIEREQTVDLNVGFDAQMRTWELIIKYNGNPDDLTASFKRIGTGIVLEPLIAGYAILTVPEGYVERACAHPQIEYVEKPKNFYYVQEGPSARACIAGVTARDPFLSGKGVLMAVIDSGITYQRPEFRREDGTTRIRFFWDQTLDAGEELPKNDADTEEGIGETQMVRKLPGPPAGFLEGVEFDENWINETLRLSSERERFERMPTIDVSGHGTAVAGIAAATRTEGYQGVAPGADLVIVKLGGNNGALAGYSKTTEIMRAVTYCIRKGRELGEPMVINLSFGNTYGAHDGSSLLERFLDNAAEIGRTVICVGSGNEGNAAGHVAGKLTGRNIIDLAMAGFERSISVQLWKRYCDEFRISLRSPGGSVVSLMPERQDAGGGGYTLRVENVKILVYFGEPTPYSASQEIYLEFLPVREGEYLPEGIWRFILEPVRIVTGQFFFYLPASVTRSRGTGFLEPTPEATLTIPSTAAKVVTVGAYDASFDSYADFSGRGYDVNAPLGTRIGFGSIKPDVVAPGVNVLAPDPFGGYGYFTGTSFSTPIVSGSAALLMEWGIVRGNDPYLYGEKIKAYLRRGAQPIRGEMVYPNEKVGFGAACVLDSIPK
ncbi:MAG: S8 family serine peptidase [Lachnospiraceae bacterium]|nr:S8 family serine peptidase [Lachnospiraceae bacterium]MBR3510293.1 S8 family serine peptidase [Lachnospiraceae bacterium]MBR4605286.1 S8 family serine peptidase [Lachnospiraceae bacterium]